ncbi:MAG: hypothetical protein KGL39_21055 [Patescibacteria group bacterium]|nr:hypothetical protein [Patescibacteria group bacterium]
METSAFQLSAKTREALDTNSAFAESLMGQFLGSWRPYLEKATIAEAKEFMQGFVDSREHLDGILHLFGILDTFEAYAKEALNAGFIE